jgi:hypothetical protein
MFDGALGWDTVFILYLSSSYDEARNVKRVTTHGELLMTTGK